MEKAPILSALQDGTMHLKGQFMYGSNYTFMTICQYQGQSIKAVYKPIQGVGDSLEPAYLISNTLGWNLVPPTVFRVKKSPLGPGSTQLFIEHDPNKHYFTFSPEERKHFPQVMLFDLLINNADRKGGHLLIDAADKLWLIDHGLSFHVEDKLRTVVWDHAGEPIPAEWLGNIEKLILLLSPETTLWQALQPHLLAPEISALKNRAETLLESGIFPLPPEERRAYPWPLV